MLVRLDLTRAEHQIFLPIGLWPNEEGHGGNQYVLDSHRVPSLA